MIILEPIGDGTLIKLYSDQQVMIQDTENNMAYEEIILPSNADTNHFIETSVPNIDVSENPKIQLLLNNVINTNLLLHDLTRKNNLLQESNDMLTECVLELSELLYE